MPPKVWPGSQSQQPVDYIPGPGDIHHRYYIIFVSSPVALYVSQKIYVSEAPPVSHSTQKMCLAFICIYIEKLSICCELLV